MQRRDAPACEVEVPEANVDGLRIAAIFIILVASLLGAILPIWLARSSRMPVPKLAFFVAKYFGSGVIISTAFMHLLAESEESLRNPCLEGLLPDYDWAMGIALMTVMVMFFIELVMSRFDMGFGHDHHHDDKHGKPHGLERKPADLEGVQTGADSSDASTVVPSDGSSTLEAQAASPDHRALQMAISRGSSRIPGLPNDVSYPPGGEDHLGHQREHTEGDSHSAYAAQMTALFILEFGVIFHGIFIGLTLAVKQANSFVVFFLVILFHQFFEGLGLGARLATVTWPGGRRKWTPYVLGFIFAISTPLAMAVGLGVKSSLQQGSATSLIVNGVFDAVSGGILLYTGLVELLAHEFMFSPEMRNAGFDMQMFAYICVAVGAGLMALLANWA